MKEFIQCTKKQILELLPEPLTLFTTRLRQKVRTTFTGESHEQDPFIYDFL
ncbi:MAG: hypothetical protein M3Q81_00365 [bacterium]|nr:hypothetical protein [bacterium]